MCNHSLGTRPLNGGIFYGNADLQVQVFSSDRGGMQTQTALEVPVTSQT